MDCLTHRESRCFGAPVARPRRPRSWSGLPLALCALPMLALVACGDAKKSAAVPAATVKNAAKEAELATVTLTPAAEQRLGIAVATAERRTVPLTRDLGGEVVAPPGRRMIVQAPVSGTVLPPDSGVLRAAGSAVAAGEVVLRLLALPPESDVLRSEEEVQNAKSRLTLARAEADRFSKMAKAGAVTARESEQAQTTLQMAEETARAAQARFDRLSGKRSQGESPGLTAIAISAPDGGTLLDVRVAPGQIVSVGSPLFELVRLEEMWVRVPVYAGDVAAVAVGRGATVQALGDALAIRRAATSIPHPPTANATAASVDLYYALPNADRRFRPGQSVTVTLPLVRGEQVALVVPREAILYDMHGGSWVYERTAEHVYTRRRVEVRAMAGGVAVLARGVREGATIVRVGAAELFGTEFGTGK